MINTTLATAFYDIGRGKWTSYKRTVEDYMNYFKKVSLFPGNMVIYCDEIHRDMISKIRPVDEKTKLITIPFEELEFYKRFFDRTKNVMESDQFRGRVVHHDIPEMLYPEYNIINFNKISFVVDAIHHFNTPVYGWVDFGFGHGRIDISKDTSFCERVTSGDKLYMGCLRQPVDQLLYHPWSYFSNEIFITGSCFMGTRKSIYRFNELICDVIDKSLNQNLIDDDQTIYNMAYLSERSLFNLRRGGWFNQFEAGV